MKNISELYTHAFCSYLTKFYNENCQCHIRPGDLLESSNIVNKLSEISPKISLKIDLKYPLMLITNMIR